MLAYNIAQQDFSLEDAKEALGEVCVRGYMSLPIFNQQPDSWLGHIQIWNEHIEQLSQIQADIHLKPAYEAILEIINPADFEANNE